MFSMASSFIEDILGSEVDEKAVSAFVGSLESQLASPSGGSSSGANTTNTLPHSQRSNQVPSSLAASNSSQSNNSSVATVININTATGSPTISGKSTYNCNSSSSTSTPINIAPRPVVTSAISLAPKTVTLLSPQNGNRGYLPVQTTNLGLPLMMGQVRGQLPHAPRLVSAAMSLPRTDTPQNTVHKITPQIHSVQQTGSIQRVAIKQEQKSQLKQPPALLNNNLRLHTATPGKPVQNHAMVIKGEPKVVANHVPHSTGAIKSEPGNAVVTQHSNMVSAPNSATAQAQVYNRVKEQVMKLQSFFTRLITLATAQSQEIGKVVQELIKAVMVRLRPHLD